MALCVKKIIKHLDGSEVKKIMKFLTLLVDHSFGSIIMTLMVLLQMNLTTTLTYTI